MGSHQHTIGKRMLSPAVSLVIAALVWNALAAAVWATSVVGLGQPKGYVNDYTRTLTGSEKDQLTTICKALERANSTELAIAIIDSTDGRTIESYAQDLFNSWGIGKSYANNGVLILVAMNDRKWRVHVGYGVEGVLPDTLARRIMENEAVPEFRNGQYGLGLINAATRMKSVLVGETYETSRTFNFAGLLIPFGVLLVTGILIWLGVRVKCPRCGSRVTLTRDRDVLSTSYNHSGIRKRDYECTVCHHKFSRMTVIPMLVEVAGGTGGGGWAGGGGGAWSGGGGGGFGGFGGGSSGGGGASGGW
jgi:uncharacterized protein